MKKFSINRIVLPVCIAALSLLSSCSLFDDFLTVYPSNQITGEQFWEDKNDLESVMFSCYKQLTNNAMATRMFVWGELRSDNFALAKSTSTDLNNIDQVNLLSTNSYFDYSSVYTAIGRCNLVLSKGEEIVKKDNSYSEGDWKADAAEVKAIRALAYFYLVRAFRDVPFNVKSTDTSEGVRNPQPVTPSEEILTYLIKDLEECKDDAIENFGNAVDNHGRFTKVGIYTLLADLYLWRASKNQPVDSIQVYGDQYKKDYERCSELCDFVIKYMNQKFNEEGQDHYGKNESILPELPLYVLNTIGDVTNVPYNEVFGNKNSLESIFEVQYGAYSSDYQSYMTTFFGGFNTSGSSLYDCYLQRSSVFEEVHEELLPTLTSNGFWRTDIRLGQTFYYGSSQVGTAIPTGIAKYLVKNINFGGSLVDVTATKGTFTYSGLRYTSKVDANRILYRASDVILMKAEAMIGFAKSDSIKEEAFSLAYAVYKRSNPYISKDMTFDDLDGIGVSGLQSFIFAERQREFYAEGKRWFDLVRLSLKQGGTGNAVGLLVSKYPANANAVKAKLATMNAMYNPFYKEEMKVNPALVQNPAWEDNDTSERN